MFQNSFLVVEDTISSPQTVIYTSAVPVKKPADVITGDS
jgi:hypothetical protein